MATDVLGPECETMRSNWTKRLGSRNKVSGDHPEEEEEALEEDDSELLEENTGTSSEIVLLKQVVESSEDVLDDDVDLPQVQDIQRIWDDERAGRGQEDEEDMDDFIDY
ncbi:hypothetical protein BKA83DRAFT_4492675 [Pisolithus microcarpus]|nr:hypothetical protein BKA83DRAFT_4492675 [Pisolithus microcarpus]